MKYFLLLPLLFAAPLMADNRVELHKHQCDVGTWYELGVFYSEDVTTGSFTGSIVFKVVAGGSSSLVHDVKMERTESGHLIARMDSDTGNVLTYEIAPGQESAGSITTDGITMPMDCKIPPQESD